MNISEKLEKLTGGFLCDGLNGKLRYSKYNKWIAEMQGIIHRQIPRENYNIAEVASTTFDREEIFEGVNYKKAVIFLMSNGCEWALKNGNGCTMCGHLAKQTRKNNLIAANDHVSQFEKEFKRIDFKKYPLLNLFNNGSFLNDNEIAPLARKKILKMIHANPDIKMLVIESRPEFVTREKIREIKGLLPGKYVEVAVGLELKDDLYRILCLNKGFTLTDFDRAAGIITEHLHLRTYVFLKPIFLTEKESIKQTIATIEHAFAVKASTVSLEACTVQDFTFTKFLYDRNLYTPPWLWSIIEVVKQCKKHQRLIIGLFKFYPSPAVVPYNCPQCSDRIMDVIRHYNRTLDPAVFNSLGCRCKKQWEEVLNEEPLFFEERLEAVIHQLNLEKDGSDGKN